MDETEIDRRVHEEMASAGGLGGGVTDGQGDVHNVKDELLRLDERLKALVDTYEEKPSAIDRGVLNTINCAVDVEAAIAEAYRTMKSRVFTEESPLRADNDLWEAFREQQDEFIEFYKSALNAVENHKELLLHYSLVKEKARKRPRHGDLERIRQDNHVYVEERDECITAVSNFYGKFSAMLTDLRT